MQSVLKPWRESASLILVAKTSFAPHVTLNDYNYKFLSIKRSSKSGFMPGTYVFPGGNVEKADQSRDWLKLYEKFGFKNDTFEKLNVKQSRPAIFQKGEPDTIPKFLSLRIGAIRETFEECGILICRSYKINYKERSARWASFIGGPEIKKWQAKVHDDPAQFIELCQLFEVYPDVWSLKEWSNWATPPQMPIRFDTVFFLAAFHQTPAAYAEKHEVQHLEWTSPKELVNRNRREDIWLPPPQYYEISRIGSHNDIDILSKFANERSEFGLERYFPMRISTDDGLYTILPGDELYVEPNPENVEVAIMEKLPPSDVHNRILHKTNFHNQLFTQNCKPKCHHIAPTELSHEENPHHAPKL